MSFFRKTGAKIAGSILCVISLTASIIGGVLIALLISAGVYDSNGDAYTLFSKERMYRDAHAVYNDYFDPNEPESPWKSYFSGGIYTGESSNFLYAITDENDKTLLATYDGKTPVTQGPSYTHSWTTQEEVPLDDTYSTTSSIICVEDTFFIYDEALESFSQVNELIGSKLSGAKKLPVEVYEEGFTYDGSHYGYNGSDFLRYENWENYAIKTTTAYYTIHTYLREGVPYPDAYRRLLTVSDLLQNMRFWIIAITAFSVVLTIVLLSILGCAIGRVNGKEEPVLSALYRIPPDLALLAVILLGTTPLMMMMSITDSSHLTTIMVWNTALIMAISTLILYAVTALCVRCKTHTLVSGSLIYWCIHNIGRICRGIIRLTRRFLGYLPLLWKVLLCYGALCLLELIGLAMFFWGDGTLYFIWFLEKLALGALVTYVTLCFRRLKIGAEHIASGNYNTKIDETHLILDFKDTADTLNHIQDGMTAAVESRMRSERLKTELITNVSHDLKTPLTSIVSYVDLLKQEPAGSEAAEEYLNVLERQSQRLKKLIEDLVEASKASTGNITAVKEPLDFVMLLGQALGEYSQRLTTAELTPVLHLPETPAMVLADGRLLWRVFDNLLGNIVKYAMPGTRVYISAEAEDTVTATFRNISRDALDVSADELMERFVRGDASRHTEGSGLGLSIARSLTESMGGTFQLSVDGDLFKAMVTFPLLTEEAMTQSLTQEDDTL